jgi:hypothetical protein
MAAYMRQWPFDVSQNTTHIGESESDQDGVAAKGDTAGRSERSFRSLKKGKMS